MGLGASGQEAGLVMTDTLRTTQQHDTGANSEGPYSGGREVNARVFGLPCEAPEPLRGQNLISPIDVLCGRGSDSITADQFHLMSVREDHEDVRTPREISFPAPSNRLNGGRNLVKNLNFSKP
ncbi:hypothetical protein PAPYR_5259 [Paratrimastix pyriformis]|uniref:Uncharacterized protein n=1 Tax=Paratrimastix pyriformis TaxID=342808 RepID=A0ABQ8UIA8_9EUKA|nr:hypothetical protein PAPYR_5259 [Paratrimastix pyriformis]